MMRHFFHLCVSGFVFLVLVFFSDQAGAALSMTIVSDIMGEGTYFIALESREIAREVRYAFMSEKELKADPDYLLFGQEDQKVGLDFVDLGLLQHRANSYCFLNGFDEAVSFQTEYVEQDEFEDGVLRGLVGWGDSEIQGFAVLSRVSWELNKAGQRAVVKTRYKKLCPHLFFSGIQCKKVRELREAPIDDGYLADNEN